jgi:bZIP factor
VVPAGCLLEIKVPVAIAIAEANAANASNGSSSSPPLSPSTGGKPILPQNIVSTSYPGVALMDYTKQGAEELDLVKDEPVRVFKRYNHWSYVCVPYPTRYVAD